MNQHTALAHLVVLTGVALLTAPPLRAADDIIVNTFATADEAAQWSKWWGAAPQTYEFDATRDADGDAASGSLKVTVNFDRAAYGGDNQFAMLRQFSVIDGTQYTNLVLDLFWDPASPTRPFGDFGTLEPGFRNQDFSQNWLPSLTVTTNPGWIHLVIPINPTATKLEAVTGIVLKMWSGADDWGQTGTAVFWVDNVKLIAAPEAPAPPPTLAIEKAKPGLRAFASASGAQYQRQNIRTVNPVYSWVDAGGPVTYSFTLGDFPGGAFSGFQAHMFLVAQGGVENWVTAPDWNITNVVFVQVGGNADGSAYANFMYKTNLPSGNSMYYGAGTLGSVGSSKATGTWSVTFNDTSHITLTSPSGSVTNFSMPPEAAALFAGPLYAYFGVQPNNLANIGQSATFSRLQISGVATPADETFTGPLDSSTWQIVADDVTGVVPVGSDVLFWLNWTLPDRGWVLQYTENLDDRFWNDYTFPTLQIGGLRRSPVKASDLPPSFLGHYFFQMIQR